MAIINFAFRHNKNLVMLASTMFELPQNQLERMGISSAENIYYQLPPDQLMQQAIENPEGVLSDSGALVIDTGEFTGRSPRDRFIFLLENQLQVVMSFLLLCIN